MQSNHRRRRSPRVVVDSLCSEHQEETERHSVVIEMSPDGLRIQRPVVGMPRSRVLQLELEIPEVDEIVWASGEICFDEVHRVSSPTGLGLSGLVRTSGVRVVAASNRHRRLLREYVYDTWSTASRTRIEPASRRQSEWAMRAACYRN